MSVDFKDYTRKMDKTLDVLQDNFGAVRAGRANAKVLDRITVEYYGVDTPLAQVGTISSPRRPDPGDSALGYQVVEGDSEGHSGF